MAGPGGKRPNAGRKRKADKYRADINRLEKQIRDRLPGIVSTQIDLALGGTTQTVEIWEPAGMVQIEDVVETGPVENLRTTKIKRLVFPDLPPDQLVLVRRTVTTAGPDGNAGRYLINRIAGNPTPLEEVEAETTGPGVIVNALVINTGQAELTEWRSKMLEAVPVEPLLIEPVSNG